MLAASASSAQSVDLDRLAERYVKLVLAVGLHDADYVDAYYGPPAWKDDVSRSQRPPAVLRAEAEKLLDRLSPPPPPDASEIAALRHRYLAVQTRSLIARLEMLEGRRFTFDEESRRLYDAVAPVVPDSTFDRILGELERLIPGAGTLAERYDAWQHRFHIPPEKLPAVFRAAVEEARARTLRRIRLPEGESFAIEYVKDQVWSAYNWYKGGARSIIQVNTDSPLDIGGAVALAAHEGYPGHHVYNALLEDRLTAGRGWVEYSVYALYSPQSLIAEGTAEYGVELAFPEADRLAFDERSLFPLAGLDPADAPGYHRVRAAAERLKHAVNQAARRYLDGAIGRDACRDYLIHYALMPPDRAERRVRFIDKNRAYVINYNLGLDLVRKYLAARGGSWSEFEKLLSSPRLPSGLA